MDLFFPLANNSSEKAENEIDLNFRFFGVFHRLLLFSEYHHHFYRFFHFPLIIAVIRALDNLRSILLVFSHFFSLFVVSPADLMPGSWKHEKHNTQPNLWTVSISNLQCFNFPLVCFALWKRCHCVQHVSIENEKFHFFLESLRRHFEQREYFFSVGKDFLREFSLLVLLVK